LIAFPGEPAVRRRQ